MDTNEFTQICYFYSSIAQSTAALIGLFGIFAVFKVQYSNMQKEDGFKAARAYIKSKCFDEKSVAREGFNFVDPDVNHWLDKDVPSHLREIISCNCQYLGFVDYYLFVNSLQSHLKELIHRLLVSMIALGLLLIFSLSALAFLKGQWLFWSSSQVNYSVCRILY